MDFDIPNWLALIIEIGIAIPFAIFLYVKQDKVSKQLREIAIKQERLQEMRRDISIIHLRVYLEALKETLEEIKKKFEDYEEKSNSNDNMEPLRKIWQELNGILRHYTDGLKNTSHAFSDVHDPIVTQKILDICQEIDQREISQIKEFEVLQCKHTIEKIERLLGWIKKQYADKSEINELESSS